MTDRLEELRREIDGLDSEIVRLLNQRARAAIEIGRLKLERGAPLYVPEREREVMRKLTGQNEGPLCHGSIRIVFREIMRASLSLEHHERVFAGGADEAELSRAVRHVAGGNTELRCFESPDALSAASRAEPAALVAAADAWLSALTADGELRWMGCWRVEAEAGPAAAYHLLSRTGEASAAPGPVTIHALADEAGIGAMLASDWFAKLPVRAVEAVPVGDERTMSVLTFRMETDDASVIQSAVGDIAGDSSVVWTT